MSKQAGINWGNICERVDTCALTGAAAFVAGIPGTEILVNGPLWCYFYALRYLEHSDYGMAQRFHGSQPDNTAVVYGSEKYILEALERLHKQGWLPELLFVESSCSMSLIGDDLNGIVAKAGLPCPYVTMDCGGLLGGFVEGYTKAALTVLEKFIAKNDEPSKNTVNLVGQTDFYLHGRDDTLELVRLLQKAGYRVQAVPGGGTTLEQLQHVGRAQLNIVTNEELGLPLAKYLEQQLGTPYLLAGLPYGVQGTKAWLEQIAQAMPVPSLYKVQEEAEATQAFLTSWLNDARCQWGSLWYDKVIVSAPPTQSLCLAEALRQEFVDTAELIVLCQGSMPKTRTAAYCSVADNIHVAHEEAFDWSSLKTDAGQLLLLGSSSESSLLYRQGRSFGGFNIAYPANEEVYLTEQPLVGLTGSKQLCQKLWNDYIRQCLRKQGGV